MAAYRQRVAVAFEERLTPDAVMALRDFADDVGLAADESAAVERDACRELWFRVISDSRVSDVEKDLLQTACNSLGIEPEQAGFDKRIFDHGRALALIEDGRPESVAEVPGLPIRPLGGEHFYWCCPAAALALRQRTTAIHYAGVTGSFRIMKGVRFRAGSVQLSQSKQEYLSTQDIGHLWLSDKRLGFHGPRKSFVVPWDKLSAFEVTADGLRVYKEGRETPYLIRPDSIDVPAAIASWVLNQT